MLAHPSIDTSPRARSCLCRTRRGIGGRATTCRNSGTPHGVTCDPAYYYLGNLRIVTDARRCPSGRRAELRDDLRIRRPESAHIGRNRRRRRDNHGLQRILHDPHRPGRARSRHANRCGGAADSGMGRSGLQARTSTTKPPISTTP